MCNRGAVEKVATKRRYLRGSRAKRAVAVAAIALCTHGLAVAVAVAIEPPDHAAAPHRLIGVTPTTLHPDVERIHPDDTFGWLNYSSSVLRISFDESVADKLVCQSPGSFRLRHGRLESGDVGLSQFATLCHLSPGDYEYRVDLYPAANARSSESDADGALEPERTLRGRLVVRWAAAVDPLR